MTCYLFIFDLFIVTLTVSLDNLYGKIHPEFKLRSQKALSSILKTLIWWKTYIQSVDTGDSFHKCETFTLIVILLNNNTSLKNVLLIFV